MHERVGHSDCAQCHEDTPGRKENFMGAEACAACHPGSDPGKCGLVEVHPPMWCFDCHKECEEVVTTTTVGPDPTTTTTAPPSDHIGTCLKCHSTDDLHEYEGHSNCSGCHDGTAQSGNVEPGACITCHPTGDPDKCNLVDIHGSSCYECHFECTGGTTTSVKPTTTTTTVPSSTHIGTCSQCHHTDDLHERAGHSECSICHDGTPQAGNVEPSACILCHPIGNAGKCNLANIHGSSCLTCHFECEGNTTTTSEKQIPDTTTTSSATQPCTAEEIYGEDSEEVELLRHLRDNVLGATPEGQEMIRLYYQWSPIIVKTIENDDESKEEIKEIIDGLLLLIRAEVD